MEKWPVDKDMRNPDEFTIYLKASNITNTQRVMDAAVSISDKYGLEVNSKISKSSHSIDFWVTLKNLESIAWELSIAYSIIKEIHDFLQWVNHQDAIKKQYDSLTRSVKSLVRSILRAVQKLHDTTNSVEISYKGDDLKFDLGLWAEIVPFINILLDEHRSPAIPGEIRHKKVDYNQEILNLLASKENMEITTIYLEKLNKSSIIELNDSEKYELLHLLKKGKS